MQSRVALVAILLFSGTNANAQLDRDFSGTWHLNRAKSEMRDMVVPADKVLKVDQSGPTLSIVADGRAVKYPLDGKTTTAKVGEMSWSIATKWEGSALLVNVLASGPQNFTLMERWRMGRGGATLTIKRTLVRAAGEIESLLVYEEPSRLTQQSPPPADAERPTVADAGPSLIRSRPRESAPSDEEYVLPTGTRMLLRLTNAVNTKHTAVGDRVYLETAAPVFVNGRLVVPVGSFVAGTVTESQQAGRVKGKAALHLQFDSLTLRSGISRDLRSRAGSVDSKGNLDRKEGRIEGEGRKGGDAATVGKTTAAGTGIGAIAGRAAGRTGMGAGIGAAAGAAAGLAGVLGSRGPDVVLPQGTTMELVLDRELRYKSSELEP